MITKEYYRMSSVAYVMLCGARDRSCGQQAISASFTIFSTFFALDSEFFLGEKLDSCGSPGSLLSWYGSLRHLAVTARRWDTFLTMKIRRGTKHYLAQMLLAINWRYWQAGKNSRKRMRVQGCLMQARFIEIHQVLEKKRSVAFLTDHVSLLSMVS